MDKNKVEHKRYCFACALHSFVDDWLKDYPKEASSQERKEDASLDLIFKALVAKALMIAADNLNKNVPGLKHYERGIREAVLLGGVIDMITQVIRNDRENEKTMEIFEVLSDFVAGTSKQGRSN